jgi:hypothetical protein
MSVPISSSWEILAVPVQFFDTSGDSGTNAPEEPQQTDPSYDYNANNASTGAGGGSFSGSWNTNAPATAAFRFWALGTTGGDFSAVPFTLTAPTSRGIPPFGPCGTTT